MQATRAQNLLTWLRKTPRKGQVKEKVQSLTCLIYSKVDIIQCLVVLKPQSKHKLEVSGALQQIISAGFSSFQFNVKSLIIWSAAHCGAT